jgi:hypothetical protein
VNSGAIRGSVQPDPQDLTELPLEDKKGRRPFYTYVQPNYFEMLGIPISVGSGFRPAEQHDAGAILTESVALKLWPGKNPVGQTLVIDAELVPHRRRAGPAGRPY